MSKVSKRLITSIILFALGCSILIYENLIIFIGVYCLVKSFDIANYLGD